MALTFSTGLINNIASGMGWGDALKNGVIKVFDGTRPTSANDAPTGTLLCTITTGTNSAFTAETRATGLVDFTNTTGNCTTLTVGGVSIISGTITYTSAVELAAAVAANINATYTYPDYYAVVGGTTIGSITYGSDNKIVYIIAPKNSGTSLNGLTIAVTVAAGTAAINGGSSTTLGGTGATAGVAAVTCLSMSYPATNGVISKSGTWQDTSADASGTATWFRYVATPNYDTGLTSLTTTGDAARLIMRLDGSVGSSGADMIISSPSIVSAASQTVNQFDLTIS